jgi:arylsulfatase A-like enzyme
MHGPQLDEPVVRVPLIIRLPEGAVPSGWAATILRGLGLKRPLRGRPIDHLVRVTDIFPTVLASVGLPIPENLDGINLLPAMTGAASPELWAYAESGRSFVDGDPDRYVEGVGGKMRMVREQDWKLIFVPKPDGGEYRLFDLREDPGEERNVAEEYPDKLEALRLRLRPLLLPANGETERVLTEAEKEQLRQLGYL